MIEGKRVLILYITEHSGHHSAAIAIKAGLELKDPKVTIACINAFQYVFPFAERIIHRLYLTVIKNVPKIWEKMYDNPKLIGRSQWIKDLVHLYAVKKLKKLIGQFSPDVIVCTQAFPCGIVADYKKKHLSKVSLIGVLTDFAPHSYWIYDQVDAYVVASDDSREMLIQKGVPEGKINTLGIPIDPKFAKVLDQRELCANYGLDCGIPVIMLMGGSHGLGPIKEILSRLDDLANACQMIVVCGINRSLYEWINNRAFKKRILNFKYTDQIDRLMTVSSVLITKPGGITTAEALAKKLPMIILNPIPGQEERNTWILIKKSAALKIDSPEEITLALEKVLKIGRQQKGDGLFSNTDRLSKPKSSLEIADLILKT